MPSAPSDTTSPSKSGVAAADRAQLPVGADELQAGDRRGQRPGAVAGAVGAGRDRAGDGDVRAARPSWQRPAAAASSLGEHAVAHARRRPAPRRGSASTSMSRGGPGSRPGPRRVGEIGERVPVPSARTRSSPATTSRSSSTLVGRCTRSARTCGCPPSSAARPILALRTHPLRVIELRPSHSAPCLLNTESAWAEGIGIFAGAALLTVGLFQFLEGVAAAAKDDVFVRTTNYVFYFDLTTWGWIHIVVGLAGRGRRRRDPGRPALGAGRRHRARRSCRRC